MAGCRSVKTVRFSQTTSARKRLPVIGDPQKRMFSRSLLAKQAALNDGDLAEVRRCRQDYNRLGFAYQLGFVRLLNRFPQQQPFEVIDELLVYTGVQLGLPTDLIEPYQNRQPTLSEHQHRIAQHLGLRHFGEAEATLLERSVFEEAYRLEQTAALKARATEYLKGQKILQPADRRITRIVGEQRRRAREDIFKRVTAALSPRLEHALDELLVVKPGEHVSELQRLKANPDKPSVEAILATIKKLRTIEATGVRAIDLGRIFKTEFILQYMSEPELRARVRRGLLKVEQLHALARDVYYGRRGRVNAREVWEQMSSCSCLTLLVACIVYWQAKQISRTIATADPEGNGVDLSLLQHVSPIGWENITLYGEYVLDRRLIKRRRRHREA